MFKFIALTVCFMFSCDLYAQCSSPLSKKSIKRTQNKIQKSLKRSCKDFPKGTKIKSIFMMNYIEPNPSKSDFFSCEFEKKLQPSFFRNKRFIHNYSIIVDQFNNLVGSHDGIGIHCLKGNPKHLNSYKKIHELNLRVCYVINIKYYNLPLGTYIGISNDDKVLFITTHKEDIKVYPIEEVPDSVWYNSYPWLIENSSEYNLLMKIDIHEK